jgi:hypothetical protein
LETRLVHRNDLECVAANDAGGGRDRPDRSQAAVSGRQNRRLGSSALQASGSPSSGADTSAHHSRIYGERVSGKRDLTPVWLSLRNDRSGLAPQRRDRRRHARVRSRAVMRRSA